MMRYQLRIVRRDVVNLAVGVYAPDEEPPGGWMRVCEREKLPVRTTTEPDWPVTLVEGRTPEWFESYLEEGGVAIVSDAHPEGLPFSAGHRGEAQITRARFPLEGMDSIRVPGIARLYRGEGWGRIQQHEKRITKNGIENDRFPLMLRRTVGEGTCYYTGVPLTRLLTVMGDTLRRFSPFTEVSERVAGVDKERLIRILVWTLRRGFREADLPYPHLWYFPGGSEGVFSFRVDVDGVFGDHLSRLSRAGADCGLPISFFANKQKCQGDENRVRAIDTLHEVGNHADVHNLYNTVEENRQNLRRAQQWLEDLGWDVDGRFVAPRGMWNRALDQALEAEGYTFSGDFALQFDGFPYFPRMGEGRSSVLQVPPHPYSVERAVIDHEQRGVPPPTAEDVLDYFTEYADFAFRNRLPVVLYSHPEQFGPMASEVLPRLKQRLEQWGARIASHGELADWWRTRDETNLNCEYDPDNTVLSVSGEIPDSVHLRVIGDQGIDVEGPLPAHRIRRIRFEGEIVG